MRVEAQVGRRPPVAVSGRSYRRKSHVSLAFKRGFDLAVAGLGMLVALPLFAAIAVLIKLDSPGPVFFRQSRVGRHRRPFLMWKFRKMHANLPIQGPSLTMRYDFRMTRFGRILERTKLDELPQLINVLVGDMSVIGPRPEVPKFVEHYPDRWDDVLSVKPGIFGPNQLRNRNESELYPPGVTDVEGFYIRHILPDKLEIDGRYARSAGPLDDLLLLVRCLITATFGAVTWRTVVTMRQQAANFLILSAAGIGGMVAAHALCGLDLSSTAALHAVLLATLVKPLSLLVLRVPKLLALSLTADDLLRLVRCAVGSAAAIVLGMFSLGHVRIAGPVFVLDTALFLGALLIYKLVLYSVHITFHVQPTRAMLRRMVVASLAAAPVTMAVTLFWLGLTALHSGRELAGILLVALVVRPTVALLMGAPDRSTNRVIDVLKMQLHLAIATAMGSGLMLVGATLASYRMIRGEVLLDAVLFHGVMSIFVLWSQTPTSRRTADGLHVARARRERILLAGSGIELGAYIGALDALPETRYEIVGIVTPHDHYRASMVGGHPVLGGLSDLPQILSTLRIDQLVVVPNGIARPDLNSMRKTAAAEECDYVTVPLLAGILSRIDSNGRGYANGHGPNGSNGANGNANGSGAPAFTHAPQERD